MPKYRYVETASRKRSEEARRLRGPKITCPLLAEYDCTLNTGPELDRGGPQLKIVRSASGHGGRLFPWLACTGCTRALHGVQTRTAASSQQVQPVCSQTEISGPGLSAAATHVLAPGPSVIPHHWCGARLSPIFRPSLCLLNSRILTQPYPSRLPPCCDQIYAGSGAVPIMPVIAALPPCSSS